MEGTCDQFEHENDMLPGFRFHPTDEELVNFYLRRKVEHKPFAFELITEVDIYKFDPWDLAKMATLGESQREWYFFSPRDRKYRNSDRPNRVTLSGFWKATGTDRQISSIDGSNCIGLKKTLVFYKGKAAKGSKTDWMMHEFRLPASSSSTHESIPALCRIFKRKTSISKPSFPSECKLYTVASIGYGGGLSECNNGEPSSEESTRTSSPISTAGNSPARSLCDYGWMTPSNITSVKSSKEMNVLQQGEEEEIMENMEVLSWLLTSPMPQQDDWRRLSLDWSEEGRPEESEDLVGL